MLKMFAIGNLGADALVKDVQGKKVIEFSIAHTERYVSGGTPQEKTVWVRCSYWIEKTTIATYLKKGTQVFVEGFPSSNAYTNKDGVAVGDLRLRVSSIQLLGAKPQQGSGDNTHTHEQTNTHTHTSADTMPSYDDAKDDLPF